MKLSESSLGISIAMIIIGRKRKGKGDKRLTIGTTRVCSKCTVLARAHGGEASEPLVSGSPAVLSSGRSAEPFSTGPRVRSDPTTFVFSPLCPLPSSFFFCRPTTVAVSSQGFAMLTFRRSRQPFARYQLSHRCFLERQTYDFADIECRDTY